MTMTFFFSGAAAAARRQGRNSLLVDGGVALSLVAGLLAAWLTAALLMALLAHPVHTMTTLDRHGTRGLPQVLKQGSLGLLALVHGAAADRSGR
ncbi:MAG: hypothetical protein H0V80_18805 [Acidobacteria bacterium]|nr:hypothetical protein [Acidobacteriota bacterium]